MKSKYLNQRFIEQIVFRREKISGNEFDYLMRQLSHFYPNVDRHMARFLILPISIVTSSRRSGNEQTSFSWGSESRFRLGVYHKFIDSSTSSQNDLKKYLYNISLRKPGFINLGLN